MAPGHRARLGGWQDRPALACVARMEVTRSPPRPGRRAMSLAIIGIVYPIIFITELPDKTMFASLALAARGRPGAVLPRLLPSTWASPSQPAACWLRCCLAGLSRLWQLHCSSLAHSG